MNPFTRIARETVLRKQPVTPPDAQPPRLHSPARQPTGSEITANPVPQNSSEVVQEDLGTESLNGVDLHGIRKTRMVPADRSGTGKVVRIVDEYWYSPELSIYMIVRHNDPRSGEQTVAVSEVDRHAPDALLFGVPANYKVVDETPVE